MNKISTYLKRLANADHCKHCTHLEPYADLVSRLVEAATLARTYIERQSGTAESIAILTKLVVLDEITKSEPEPSAEVVAGRHELTLLNPPGFYKAGNSDWMYVNTFCLGCRKASIPGDPYYHTVAGKQCGPITLVHAEIRLDEGNPIFAVLGDKAKRSVEVLVKRLETDDEYFEDAKRQALLVVGDAKDKDANNIQ